jgi:hypothetical protein
VVSLSILFDPTAILERDQQRNDGGDACATDSDQLG